MKSRHAAALALVVWYLRQPPVVGQGSGRNVWNHAPLRKWERAATFDSEEVCNQRLRASRTVKGPFENFTQALVAEQFNHGRCVRSNDPRLKPK
jgi:hypothetical protein